VVGSASATGSSDNNKDLASCRAYNAAIYAIRGFEEKQKTDQSLQGAVISPNVLGIGDDLAKEEAKLLHIDHSPTLEKKQNHFRAAMFRFKAGLQHPGKGAVYFIREVYVFKFKPAEVPLPVLLAKIKKVTDFPGVSPSSNGASRSGVDPSFETTG
jgi:hypothetical protein